MGLIVWLIQSSDMSDLISIIIPCYNIAPYIERCLRSVLGQTHQNFEIIVINDGSTDETAEIIDRIAKTDERMVVIHKENTGVSDTRNRGLEIAHGAYIGFVDGDDEVYPDMFEFLLSNAKKHHADISHCGFELVNPDRTIPINGTGQRVIQTRNEALVSLLQGKLFEPSSCNKLYRREILEAVRYPVDIRINEDLLFNVEAFKKCERAIFEDVVKYRYMYNPSSASRSDLVLHKAKHVMLVATRIKALLEDYPLDGIIDRFYANKLINICRGLRQKDLLETDFGCQIISELKRLSPRNLGARLILLRLLLVRIPWLYDFVRCPYDIIFKRRQKWKLPEAEQ